MGEIVETGTHDELISNESVYFSLYKNKFEDSKKPTSQQSTSTQIYLPEYEDEPSRSFVVDSWYKKSLWLYLLYPFSLLFSYLTSRRRRKYIKNYNK